MSLKVFTKLKNSGIVRTLEEQIEQCVLQLDRWVCWKLESMKKLVGGGSRRDPSFLKPKNC